ncbi:MAG: aminopeptidase P family protein [Bacteroidales bacterium]|nr:aminopeptidase P family protein [Bacteroidales bacterium]MDD4770529.1 aminopeptidase P family protein [Bacteroidales bacterium]
MEKSNTNERLHRLRAYMNRMGIDVCIIPSTDPHQSEYPASQWGLRAYLSGFTGSAGTLAVSNSEAHLWTDSRYFLQAETQLSGSSIQLQRMGNHGVPDLLDWLKSQKPSVVGLDGRLFNYDYVQKLETLLPGCRFLLQAPAYETLWPERPKAPSASIQAFPLEHNGRSSLDKLTDLRLALHHLGAQDQIIASLDEIAWLLNLRGRDIRYNPVFESYVWLNETDCILFVQTEKLDATAQQSLREAGVKTAPYNSFYDFLKTIRSKGLLTDFNTLNASVIALLKENCTLINQASPIALMKACKNPVELNGFRNAMRAEGIALTRWLHWLEQKSLGSNEYECSKQLETFRTLCPDYIEESFSSIVGFKANGAIVHYEATAEQAEPIHGEGALLVDVGGHYKYGTTDCTRSIYLHGKPSSDYKRDYTDLLKGLIALSTARFPQGTRGSQLDVLARQFLWQRQENYLHGTGHGVGHCLNVHEGPQSIRMNENPTPLRCGMVVSNEPGLYRTGQYGIRLENLLCVQEYGSFLQFETLTLCPFETTCIDTKQLHAHEIQWINHYHQHVYHTLSEALDEEVRSWLYKKTKPIQQQ